MPHPVVRDIIRWHVQKCNALAMKKRTSVLFNGLVIFLIGQLTWALLLSAGGCIEPYNFPFSEESNYLVVEGSITTEPGPHTVRLTTTRNINGVGNAYALNVEDATVQIMDSEGGVELLREMDPGVYTTSEAYQGVVGRKYQLHIATADGKQYISDEEEVLPAVPMEEIVLKYGEESYVNDDQFNVSRDGFFIYTKLRDPADEKNSSLFRANISYQVFTHPELYRDFVDTCGDGGCWLPAPKDCCSFCFVNDELPAFVVANDRYVNGQQDAEVPLMFLPIDPKHYYDKVRLEVVQYSLTGNAYRFWNAYDKLVNHQGGVFDNPPAVPVSNIRNVDDETEKVLGYFYASSVSSQDVFFDHRTVPRRVEYTLVWNDDCRLLPNSTTERPDFW